MSVTFTGSIKSSVSGVNAITGNEQGSVTLQQSVEHSISAAATAPDIVGGMGYQGSFTCPTTGGTLNLADSTNICKTGAVGTIKPAQDAVITALKKLKILLLENTDTANTVTITCPHTLFVAGVGWVADQVVAVLQPGGFVMLSFPSGSSTLTAGTNDGLVFTSSAGTPIVKIAAIFG